MSFDSKPNHIAEVEQEKSDLENEIKSPYGLVSLVNVQVTNLFLSLGRSCLRQNFNQELRLTRNILERGTC